MTPKSGIRFSEETWRQHDVGGACESTYTRRAPWAMMQSTSPGGRRSAWPRRAAAAIPAPTGPARPPCSFDSKLLDVDAPRPGPNDGSMHPRLGMIADDTCTRRVSDQRLAAVTADTDSGQTRMGINTYNVLFESLSWIKVGEPGSANLRTATSPSICAAMSSR